MPLTSLISMAYLMYANGEENGPTALAVPMEGGPAWVRSERFEVEAKAEGTPPPATMKGPMLQALLEERFQLRIHREIRDVPVYALTVGKGGPKLREFVGACTPAYGATRPAPGAVRCSFRVTVRSPNLLLDGQGMTVSEFIKQFLSSLDRPVADRTGIAGRFDFHLEFVPDASTPALAGALDARRQAAETAGAVTGASEPAGASIFTALQEQLGLKLEPARGPREFLVIDRVERVSGN
jgi:uncharacterized protein (TIGR03435 family)